MTYCRKLNISYFSFWIVLFDENAKNAQRNFVFGEITSCSGNLDNFRPRRSLKLWKIHATRNFGMSQKPINDSLHSRNSGTSHRDTSNFSDSQPQRRRRGSSRLETKGMFNIRFFLGKSRLDRFAATAQTIFWTFLSPLREWNMYKWSLGKWILHSFGDSLCGSSRSPIWFDQPTQYEKTV